LIETLVALAVVAVALAAGGQATQALVRTSERQSDQMLAQLCAENALYALRLSRQMPGVGTSHSDCLQAQQSFMVEVDTQPTPNPNFRRVDVRVRRPIEAAAGGRTPPTLLHIATVVGRY
jgi:general secretion pathway protein I